MAREAVVVESARTALTKAHRGSFNITEPVDYTAHALREVVAATPGLDPGEIEDVIVGTGFPEGCQGMNMARIAAMDEGIGAYLTVTAEAALAQAADSLGDAYARKPKDADIAMRYAAAFVSGLPAGPVQIDQRFARTASP